MLGVAFSTMAFLMGTHVVRRGVWGVGHEAGEGAGGAPHPITHPSTSAAPPPQPPHPPPGSQKHEPLDAMSHWLLFVAMALAALMLLLELHARDSVMVG